MTDNAAVLQQRVTKASNVFLSTLAAPGESQFLTALKPCGILMPHMHQRANEFYSMIFGTPPCPTYVNGHCKSVNFPSPPPPPPVTIPLQYISQRSVVRIPT